MKRLKFRILDLLDYLNHPYRGYHSYPRIHWICERRAFARDAAEGGKG